MKHRSVFLVGLMAVGKSSVGKQLADELGYSFYDSDHEVEARAGAEIAWIFDVEGENGFREREMQVINDLTPMDGIVLATGGGVVLREENRRVLSDRGYVAYLTSPIGLLAERTRRDRRRPLLKDADHATTLEAFARERGPLYESVADRTFVSDGSSIRKVAREVAQWHRDVIGKEGS
ncbi:MAG: shikimate kinase AroK [Pseudomonadota bacterium]|nr:shikimate kinase AroK [Pseudomonadota bacterium]